MSRLKEWMIGLSSLSVAVGFSANAWADCQNVNTVDFIGQVCTAPGTEQRAGHWIVDDGGSLDGLASIFTNTDGSQQVSKSGTLRTASFDGKLYRTESKSATGAKTISEQLGGKETLPNGGMFDGMTSLRINADGSQQVSKSGTLRTATFDGKFYRTESKSALGTKNIVEQLFGKEVLQDGGIFDGGSTLKIYGEGNQQVSKSGTLRTASFDGKFYRTESKSATGAKTISEQLGGKETLPNGGMFDGMTSLRINADGSQQVSKSGTLRTASFDGKLYRTESMSTTGVKTSTEQLGGTWIIAPDYKLTGTYTTTQNPDGTITVTDNRTRL